jgi:hypothetical protein
MLAGAVAAVRKIHPAPTRAADQGCGKLRHLRILAKAFRQLVLVDTDRQLTSPHHLDGFDGSIRDYLVRFRTLRSRVRLLTAEQFRASALSLDVVFTIATFDVLPREVRIDMAAAAWRNLAEGGLYVVIVPRNDSTILRRCTAQCAYQDGFAFRRNGVATFYRNFRDQRPLIVKMQRAGFRLERDQSVYRQVSLIFRKAQR